MTNPAGIIWNDATGTLTTYQGSDAMLNRITLSKSTVGKCTSMQVVKYPGHEGEFQQPRNKNVPPFRRTIINN